MSKVWFDINKLIEAMSQFEENWTFFKMILEDVIKGVIMSKPLDRVLDDIQKLSLKELKDVEEFVKNYIETRREVGESEE